MDLKAFAAGESGSVPGRGFAGIVEHASSKPLIAAVEGFAVAGGLEVALACDLIVAARTARLGLPEVKRGLVAAAGGLLRLPRRVPHCFAMEMVLTGGMVGAERAERMGLVNRLAEPGQTLEVALALAEEIAANAPLAVEASKRIVHEQWGWATEEAWDRQAAISAHVYASEDCREGAAAFVEKRPPVWTGR
jgi:enoyl-CoA hydratase